MVFFGMLSVFGHCIKGMIQLWPQQVWMGSRDMSPQSAPL